MSERYLDGTNLVKLFIAAGHDIRDREDEINNLNVYPVPDGDTGSNMAMTWTSGVERLLANPSSHLGQALNVFSEGLLFGARGNSGVILSLLFIGMARHVQQEGRLEADQWGDCLAAGAVNGYSSVSNPVEGTVLTVARSSSFILQEKQTDSWSTAFQLVADAASEALLRTPDQLDILRQSGVVDAGGRGLVVLYQAFANAWHGTSEQKDWESSNLVSEAKFNVQAMFESDSILNRYDVELFIHVAEAVHIANLQETLQSLGDSLIIVPAGKQVKVHIHTEQPNEVLGECLKLGELDQVNILNMRKQHESFSAKASSNTKKLKIGVIAVSSGTGVDALFYDLGVDKIVQGGDTLNPSTAELLAAIDDVNASTILLIVNHKNIIPAAEQAVKLSSKPVLIVPSRSVVHGLSAMIAFDRDAPAEKLVLNMTSAMNQIKSGRITNAVRVADINGKQVNRGDYIGLANDELICSTDHFLKSTKQLLQHLISDEDELVSLLFGTGTLQEDSDSLVSWIKNNYPHIEVETLKGGQPVSLLWISVE